MPPKPEEKHPNLQDRSQFQWTRAEWASKFVECEIFEEAPEFEGHDFATVAEFKGGLLHYEVVFDSMSKSTVYKTTPRREFYATIEGNSTQARK